MKTITIDRARLITGKLCKTEVRKGKEVDCYCAMGWLGKSLGASCDVLKRSDVPRNWDDFTWPENVATRYIYTAEVSNIIDANDYLTDKRREAGIRKGFKKLGYGVRFIGSAH